MQLVNLFHLRPGTFDNAAGLHIAALTTCGSLTFYLAELPPQGRLNQLAHGQGNQIYLPLSGQGCLYSQGAKVWRTPLRRGDLLRIPPGLAHQLVNPGNVPLRLLSICPAGCVRPSRP